jgi:hypothetical protein
MNQPIAKPVIKNKFWVVENHGQKIATIQARDDGGFVYVHDEHREFFPSVKILKQKYKIKFGSLNKNIKTLSKNVYGFPINGRSFNEVWDVQRKLPIYSKTAKSKSLFCAGYYLIKLNGTWSTHYCPKNITLSRYNYLGPYKTKEETNLVLKELECKN